MNEDKGHSNGPDDAPGESSDPVAEAALDSLLLRFGADYNRPPDIVPREEMWHQIRQNEVPQRFIRRHPAWSSLAAAVLLLGVGIGIGAEMHSRVATRTDFSTLEPLDRGATKSQVARSDTTATAANPHSTQNVIASRAPDRASDSGRDAGVIVSMDASDPSARSTAYRLAAVRHFTAVEALLTSYQTTKHDARGDAQMASWARALLSQTRLLLDSPAAADPARQKLLQDLELVLVQMTQLSPADAPIDREMLDGTVRHSDVITRLRTAVPAGGTTHL